MFNRISYCSARQKHNTTENFEMNLTGTEKDETELPQPFPLARFSCLKAVRIYYPFGNTAAEDYLEDCSNVPHAAVLCLGSGDLRSFFYTLWKNFDFLVSSAPKRFEGASFTLNDYIPAVSARNILLLLMCLRLPEEKEERKKWLCAMWAIWYSHELYPHHFHILNSMLQILLTFSASTDKWSERENPLHSLVHFSSSESFSEIAYMWKQWQQKTPNKIRMKMLESRDSKQKMEIGDIVNHCGQLAIRQTHLYGGKIELLKFLSIDQAPEVESYLKTGCSFAESVFHYELSAKVKSELNLTMFERNDWKYTGHYNLMPFESYYHTMEFTPQNLKLPESVSATDVVVPGDSFQSEPFLANSVQQFCLWVQSSAKILKNKKVSMSLCFDTRDALAFCLHQVLQNQRKLSSMSEHHSQQLYDSINTSNLMDYVSPFNLVLACTPLLRDNGILKTSTMCCKCCADNGDELLSQSFGFRTSLFPVLLGVRCISHEGIFSNPTNIKPIPPDLSNMMGFFPHNRSFLWVKEEEAQKLCLEKLPQVQEGNITEALVGMVGSCSYSLLNHFSFNADNFTRNGIETASTMLNYFVKSLLNSQLPFAFWEHLCTAVRRACRPYLQCLQTQFLLHGIHIHLTCSEEECPLCQDNHLSSALGLFCHEIQSDFSDRTPYVMAFVHKSSVSPQVLLRSALSGEDIHIFDCFDTVSTHGSLQLKYFAPLALSAGNYKVSVVSVLKVKERLEIIPVDSFQLNKSQVLWQNYAFNQAEHIGSKSIRSHPVQQSSFGTVLSHSCDFKSSETLIKLSKLSMEYLSGGRLKHRILSSRGIMLYCRDLQFNLCYHYPIDEGTLEVTSPTSEGNVRVTCQRKPYALTDERPCYTVSPDHSLSFSKRKLDQFHMSKQMDIQFVQKENASAIASAKTPLIPHLSLGDTAVRELLQQLFEEAHKFSFFCIQSPHTGTQCFLICNELLFDYQCRTPCLDVAYCFVSDDALPECVRKWKSMVHSSKVQTYKVEEAAFFQQLKVVFDYFSRRTNATLHITKKRSRFSMLKKYNLEVAFTRSVLYLLLLDPDITLPNLEKMLALNHFQSMQVVGGSSCSYCSKLSFTTMKCGNCKKVPYCNRTCQRAHWPVHKKQCLSDNCAFCKKAFRKKDIRTPSCKCAGIQYCSDECLQRDSSTHKKTCSSIKSIKPTDEKVSYCDYCREVLALSSTKCSCGETNYCNSGCQRKDWPKHEASCQSPERKMDAGIDHQSSSTSTSSLNFCASCGSTSTVLRACTKCRSVKYCGRECQSKDWKRHKLVCK